DMLPDIEIAVMSQPEDTPVGLLLAIEDEDLTSTSRRRIQRYFDQALLPVSTLRANSGVDLDAQLQLAAAFDKHPHRWASKLAWRGFPTYDQLRAIADLMFEHFPTTTRRWGARTPNQLTLLIWRSYQKSSPRQLIASQIDYALSRGDTVDDVVLEVLTFQRN